MDFIKFQIPVLTLRIVLTFWSVDLVMWKEVSRSAFVFGLGSFVIISSSYAKEINIR